MEGGSSGGKENVTQFVDHVHFISRRFGAEQCM